MGSWLPLCARAVLHEKDLLTIYSRFCFEVYVIVLLTETEGPDSNEDKKVFKVEKISS